MNRLTAEADISLTISKKKMRMIAAIFVSLFFVLSLPFSILPPPRSLHKIALFPIFFSPAAHLLRARAIVDVAMDDNDIVGEIRGCYSSSCTVVKEIWI